MKTKSMTQGNTKQQMLTLCAYFGILLCLFLVSGFVFADEGKSLGDVAKNVSDTMTNVAKLIVAASYVAGVGFALMGMLKLKAHKDNPTQVPLSQPIVLLAIAAGLVFLPSLISTAGQTVWGGAKTAGSSSGDAEVEGLEDGK